MWNPELNDWARRLDEGDTGDPTLELAANLRRSRPAAIETPLDFKANLRARLLERYAPARPSPAARILQWGLNLAGIAALALIAWVAFRVLPESPNTPVIGIPTFTPAPAGASLPTLAPTAFPTGPNRLVFIGALPKRTSMHQNSLDFERGIYISDLGGAQYTQLVSDDAWSEVSIEAVDPNGAYLFYSKCDQQVSDDNRMTLGPCDLLRIALQENAEPEKIASGLVPGAGVVFLQSGQRLAFIGDSGQGTAIYTANLDGVDRQELAGAAEHPARLLAATADGGVIWLDGQFDEHGEPTALGGYWLTKAPGNTQRIPWDDKPGLVVSPQGDRAVYSCESTDQPTQDCRSLYVIDLDGKVIAQHAWDGWQYPPAWTPDGKRLLVSVGHESEDGIEKQYWTWDLTTDTTTNIYTHLIAGERDLIFVPSAPQWAPDESMIMLYDETSNSSIWILDPLRKTWALALEPFTPPNHTWSGPTSVFWLP